MDQSVPVGALIVIERTITLTEYIETGIRTDAVITSSMLEQIFEKNTPVTFVPGGVVVPFCPNRRSFQCENSSKS